MGLEVGTTFQGAAVLKVRSATLRVSSAEAERVLRERMRARVRRVFFMVVGGKINKRVRE
jgi:hypothetical protein